MGGTGIILAAAGSSSRLGQPKQLLPFRGSTLLRHAATAALGAASASVVVVLAPEREACLREVHDLPVQTVLHAGWQDGMGTSIARGMTALAPASPDRVIIMTCDQPAVTPEILTKLIRHQQATGAPVVASAYAGTLGPPVLFTSVHFPALLALHGHQGARSLFAGDPVPPASVPFPEGGIDIDTPADLRHLEFPNQSVL